MKKILAAVVITALTATAFASGYGFGGGDMMSTGQSYGGCGGPYYDQDETDLPPAVTDDEAKTLVQDFVDKNLKGYTVKDSQKAEMPHGNMYRFLLEDSSGNQFYMLVNPFGYLRGPVLAKSAE